MWKKRLFPSCFLLALGGCYPNKAVIDPWSYAPLSSSNPWKPAQSIHPIPQTGAPPDVPVQQEPYSLAEMIDLALRNNQQTKITWAQARSSAAAYAQSQSQFFPSLQGEFSYQRDRQPIFSGSTSSTGLAGGAGGTPSSTSSSLSTALTDIYYTFWSPEITLSYLIYDFGTLRATSEAAKQALYTADWTHNNAIAALLQQIMNDFYNYLYQEQLLIADVANIDTATLTLDAATTGFDSGVRDVSDVLQAKTQLLQNQTTWAAEKQNVETAYTTLLTNMGLPANLEMKTQSMPLELPPDDLLPPVNTLIEVALNNRPDLMAYEANYRGAEQKLLAAERQYLPQLNYTFNLAKDYYNGGVHDQYNFSSLFSVTMPFFQGFYYKNAIRVAEANKKVAHEQMIQSELDVIGQVTTYHYNVKVAFETFQFAIGFLNAAKEQYVVALAQYKQGTNTILNVVSAQSSLADARAQVASAAQLWYTSLANLAYATGLISPQQLNPFEQVEQVDIAHLEQEGDLHYE